MWVEIQLLLDARASNRQKGYVQFEPNKEYCTYANVSPSPAPADPETTVEN